MIASARVLGPLAEGDLICSAPLESLNTAGAHIFGLVINKVSRQDAGGYGYDTAYSYRTPNNPTPGPPDLISKTEKLQPMPRRQLQQQRIGERIRTGP